MIWSHVISTHVHIWFEHTSFQYFQSPNIWRSYMIIIYGLITYDLNTCPHMIWLHMITIYDFWHMICDIWSYAGPAYDHMSFLEYDPIYGRPFKSYTEIPWDVNALLNGNFKRDKPTCLPYLRKQISALFLTLHTITKKSKLLFVSKQNMQLIKVYASKWYVSNIESLRSIKMNSTQTDFQKNKTHNKIATVMTVHL